MSISLAFDQPQPTSASDQQSSSSPPDQNNHPEENVETPREEAEKSEAEEGNGGGGEEEGQKGQVNAEEVARELIRIAEARLVKARRWSKDAKREKNGPKSAKIFEKCQPKLQKWTE